MERKSEQSEPKTDVSGAMSGCQKVKPPDVSVVGAKVVGAGMERECRKWSRASVGNFAAPLTCSG